MQFFLLFYNTKSKYEMLKFVAVMSETWKVSAEWVIL